MNYGPLSKAIEELLATAIDGVRNKKNESNHSHNTKISNCWSNIFLAQDELVEDVKNGRV
jgi:hypothetical protein